jgi:propanol-preferring alcohol dehydrogenase
MTVEAMRLHDPAPVERAPLQPASEAASGPAAGELRLRVEACAVCRTDLQIVEGEIEAHRLPITPGHQVIGVVETVGEGVTGWQPGERAGVGWLAGACGTCARCQAGKENLCRDAVFTGWDRDGGYARSMTVRSDFALKIPDSFTACAAAPLLCGGVIGYRALKLSGVKPGGRLGLYGFGASALLTLQVALYWDCQVHVATRSKDDQQRAIALGATGAGGYDETPPKPLDAAVTFAPAGEVVLNALRAVDRGGSVSINAIHLDEIPAFPYEWLWWERSLRSVANYTRADAREFLDLAARIPIETSFRAYDLARANEALLAHKRGEIEGAAVLQIGEQ